METHTVCFKLVEGNVLCYDSAEDCPLIATPDLDSNMDWHRFYNYAWEMKIFVPVEFALTKKSGGLTLRELYAAFTLDIPRGVLKRK